MSSRPKRRSNSSCSIAASPCRRTRTSTCTWKCRARPFRSRWTWRSTASAFRLVKQDAVHFTHRFRNVRRGRQLPPRSRRLQQQGVHAGHREQSHADGPQPGAAVSRPTSAWPTVPSPAMAMSPCRPAPASSGPPTARSTDQLLLSFEDTTYTLSAQGDERFTATRRMMQSRNYSLVPRKGDRAAT